MSWADGAVARLRAGETVTVRPRGNSMQPKVLSGARVTLEPVRDPDALATGDIVLVRLKRSWYLHLISATDRGRVQISNYRGRVNGWVTRGAVVGIAVAIDNRGR